VVNLGKSGNHGRVGISRGGGGWAAASNVGMAKARRIISHASAALARKSKNVRRNVAHCARGGNEPALSIAKWHGENMRKRKSTASK